jgi:tetratricopeptide (TPR) repeat protein
MPAAASDRDAVAFARATALARAGHCGEALAALSELRAPTAASAHLRGQCQLGAKDYPAALASLEEAKRLDPKAPGVALHLAVARFHMGDYPGAREALDAAAPAAENDPQYHLYRGLLLLQEARSADAARELARARSLGASVEPGASYYEGLAWAGAEEREKASEALDRVIRAAPGTSWAQEAERAKADLSRLAGDRGRVWGFARAGFEYDDNVVLRAAGVELPEAFEGQHDVRSVLMLHGGSQLVGGRDWAAGVQGTYYGSAHFDLSEFNQHYPVVGLWLDRRIAEATFARLSYDVGYAWVDADPFLFTQELRPALYHDFGNAGRSEFFASFYKYNYLYGLRDVQDGPGTVGQPCPDPTAICGPPGLDEADARNRDGWGLATGVEHTLALPALETELFGGLSYLRYSARGSEYSLQGVGSWIGTETELPFDSVLRTSISYAYLPHRHASTFPDPRDPGQQPPTAQYALGNADRSDDRWRYQVEIEKYLTDTLSASLRWSYLNNNSNVGVFGYDREITGVYVTYRLPR